jgi:hypothetical protein
MMKKILFSCLLSLPLILASCTNNPSKSPADSFSSSSSSSSAPVDQKKEIESFLALLKSKEGSVKAKHVENASTSSYLTDAAPLEVSSKDVADFTRYGTSISGPIVVQKGSYSVFESETSSYSVPSTYTIETFHKDDKFYRIVHYDDTSETSYKTTLAYDADYEEQNLSLSLPNEEIALFATLSKALATNGYNASYSFPKNLDQDGDYDYSYGILAYDIDTGIKVQDIQYAKHITIQGGFIVSSSQKMTNDLFAGGKKTNWLVTTSSATYTQGSYGAYDGEIYDPSQYKEGQ